MTSYYKCVHCGFNLPVENFDYQEHSCFSTFNPATDNFYINETNELYVVCNDNNLERPGQSSSTSMETESSDPQSESRNKRKLHSNEDKVWSQYDEPLINSIMHQDILWNFSIPVQDRSPLKVQDAWTKVQVDLDGKFEITEIKKRWRNLRDSYRKSKKRCTKYIASGSGADAVKKATFRFHSQMSFLDDLHAASHSSISNVVAQEHDPEHNSSSPCNLSDLDEADVSPTLTIMQDNAIKETSLAVKKKSRPKSFDDVNFEDSLVRFLNCNQPEQKKISGFCESLDEVFKELPIIEKTELQMKLLDIALETLKEYKFRAQNK